MELYNTEQQKERAVLFGVHTDSRDYINDCTDDSMEELALLADTAGAEVCGIFLQNRPTPDSATYVGEGKAEEIAEFCKLNDIDLIICDDELSGTQMKNLENITDVRVIDRSALIMDIFAQRAKTKEGQLQVELAQLKYFLPRLTGSFTALSRQAGGGGIGGARRGPGETKLETDKRHIKNRIYAIEEQLREVEKHRGVQRSKRVKEGVQQIAIVGYTNAGKSTLLNYLTGAGVLAEDKLFATLDPTVKQITLPDGANAVVTDTVGFIRKLPHHLIKAFKSTLEEVVYADVLMHVADASSPYLRENIAVVNDILKELNAEDKPCLKVLNKIDMAGIEKGESNETSVYISAVTGEGVDELLEKLCNLMPEKRTKVKLLVPYTDGAVISELYRNATIHSEEHTEKGTVVEATVDAKTFSAVMEYVI